MTPSLIRSAAEGIADLVWPRRCWLCDRLADGERITGALCQTCRADLTADGASTCPRCSGTVGPHSDLVDGCPQCRGTQLHFDAAVRLGPYDGLLRDAVLRLKREPGEPLAEELGGLLAAVRREVLTAHRPDAVVPVPLHWWRRWTRGYNQSGAVARGWPTRWGCRAGRGGWPACGRPRRSGRGPPPSGGRTSAAPSAPGER